MKTTSFFIAALLFPFLTQAEVLETKLTVKRSDSVLEVAGYGLVNSFEFPTADVLRLVSKYSSGGGAPVKTVICEIRNLRSLSPLLNSLLFQMLGHVNSPSSYAETVVSCAQEIENGDAIEIPRELNSVVVVVDPLTHPEAIQVKYVGSGSLRNSGYTSINVDFGATP